MTAPSMSRGAFAELTRVDEFRIRDVYIGMLPIIDLHPFFASMIPSQPVYLATGKVPYGNRQTQSADHR
jgi:hypothetical protein